MLTIPNYIENTDLEKIVDKLASNYSSKVFFQSKYKQIFNLIYYYYLLDKSYTNKYTFTEIPTELFRKISHRNYKEILIHMYDNSLIFTNVSIHKKRCGVNFQTNERIKRAYRIDRSLDHYFNIHTGKLLNKNIKQKDISILNKVLKQEKLKKENKIKKINSLRKKSFKIKNLSDFIQLINNNDIFAKNILLKLIYYYNKNKNLNYIDIFDNPQIMNNFYNRLLFLYCGNFCQQIKNLQKTSKQKINVYLNNSFKEFKNLFLNFINNNYNDINNIFNTQFFCNLSIEGDSNSLQKILESKKSKNLNYFQNLLFDPYEYKENQYIKFKICNNTIDKLILKRYSYLDINKDKITYQYGSESYKRLSMIWNKHSKARKSGHRIYSWFHQLRSQQRKYITMNGSPLRQAFDIPACNFCILAKIFQDYEIDKEQLSRFQNVVRNQYIYENIAKFGGYQLKDIKKKLKASTQHWLNIRKCNFKRGHIRDKYFGLIDEYFRVNFPGIRELIMNYQEVQHKNKISKKIWMDFQEKEYQIITQKIVGYLTKKYGVYAVTVHDAVYISQDDMRTIDQSLSQLFWKELNLKYI